jgi:hypothetical protein
MTQPNAAAPAPTEAPDAPVQHTVPALAGTDANIHARMLNVVATIGYIPKLGTGPAEQGSYAFARVEHIKDAIRDAHVAQGIMSQHTVDDWSVEVLEGGSGKRAFIARVQGRLIFINVDNPEDRFESTYAGMAVDYSDKPLAKAITAGVKAGLLNAYSIPTGKDPDEEAPTLPDAAGGQAPRQQSRPQQRMGGARPSGRAQPSQRPVVTQDGDEPPFPGDAGAPAAQHAQPAGGSVDGQCPVHHKAFRSGSRGWYCATRVGDGWCNERPSREWVAAQER